MLRAVDVASTELHNRLVNETRTYSETKAKTETRECETEIETETKNLL